MNKLKIIVNQGFSHLEMEKEIDFIPSKGLIIYEPVNGEIGDVYYNKGVYTARLIDIIYPTNPKEQINYLKSIGFK